MLATVERGGRGLEVGQRKGRGVEVTARQVPRFLWVTARPTGAWHQLFVSVNTVRHHVKSLYRKLSVNSQAEAVARARKLGLL